MTPRMAASLLRRQVRIAYFQEYKVCLSKRFHHAGAHVRRSLVQPAHKSVQLVKPLMVRRLQLHRS